MVVVGLEMDLLTVVLQQMNMTFLHVRTTEGFEWNEISFSDIVTDMYEKKMIYSLVILEKICCFKHCWTSPITTTS
jgi:hypothetical protein